MPRMDWSDVDRDLDALKREAGVPEEKPSYAREEWTAVLLVLWIFMAVLWAVAKWGR